MLLENHDITALSGYRTPTTARYYFRYTHPDDLPDLFRACFIATEGNHPVLVVSGGTNILIACDQYPGLIIHNVSDGYTVSADQRAEAQSGQSISELSEELEQIYGISVWHRFIGLPGTIGGAVYGNAGCFGLEIQHNFVSCRCVHLGSGQIVDIQKEDMEFAYRQSYLKKNPHLMCITASFDLSFVQEKYHSDVDNRDFRKNHQPHGLSCGSFFKNPSREQSAGKLIEEVGLKGAHVGGAYFADQHANFLMSDGTATYQDLLELISLAQERVYTTTGIRLENEVQIITPTSGIYLSTT